MSSRVRPSPSGEWEDRLGGPRPRPYCTVRAGHSSLPIQWTPALSGPGSRKWDSATRRDVFPHDLDRRVRKPGLPGDPGRRRSAPPACLWAGGSLPAAGAAGGTGAAGISSRSWGRRGVSSLPEAPAAHPPPAADPARPRDSASGARAGERRTRGAGGWLPQTGWAGGRVGRRRQARHRAALPTAVTRKAGASFSFRRNCKTATVPTCGTQARPQSAAAYRNEVTQKRGRT